MKSTLTQPCGWLSAHCPLSVVVVVVVGGGVTKHSDHSGEIHSTDGN